MNLSENEQKILRYLYWNHDQYKTRQDIIRDVDLTYEEVRNASNSLLGKDLINNNSKKQQNISDKHRYMISSQGISYVKDNNLKKSEKAKLREEVRQLRKDVMTQERSTVPIGQVEEDVKYLKQENRELRDRVERLERENEYLMYYVKQLIQVAEMSGYELEPWKQE